MRYPEEKRNKEWDGGDPRPSRSGFFACWGDLVELIDFCRRGIWVLEAVQRLGVYINRDRTSAAFLVKPC